MLEPEYFLDIRKIESAFNHPKVKICKDKASDLRTIIEQKFGVNSNYVSLHLISQWIEVGYNELVRPRSMQEKDKQSFHSY